MVSATTDRRMGLTGDKGMKAPVDCATTVNITLSGEQTIDGVLTSASRVLVKNQTTTTQNGYYDSSSAAWTRCLDANGFSDLVKGTVCLVTGGTQAGQFWNVTSANPITIGTSAITFALTLTAPNVSSYIATFLTAANAAAARAVLVAPGTADIQVQTYQAFTTAGTSTAYTVVTSPAAAALAEDQRYQLKWHTVNGATPTLARDGLPAKNIKVYDSTGNKIAPAVGALFGKMDVIYDGTDYVVPIAGRASSGANSDITSFNSLDSINGGPVGGFRNMIVNGAMEIDQLNGGSAQTFTAAAALAYCVDQWYGYCTGANVTGQRVAGSLQTRTRYRFTGAASVTGIGFGTRIESFNCYDLNGKTATFSVDLANSLLTTVTWAAYYATSTNTFGTLAAPTRTLIATGTFTVTSSATRYSAQFPVATTTGIEIVLSVGAQTSGTWTIGDVMLAEGVHTTAGSIFQREDYRSSLSKCQRYYWIGAGSVAGHTASGGGITVGCNVSFPVTMFNAPSLANSGGTAVNASSVDFTQATLDGGLLTVVSTGNGVFSIVQRQLTATARIP